MNNLIKLLKQQDLVWQGSSKVAKAERHSSGFSELDKQLNGGFPTTGVTEIQSINGIGELRLLLPTLTSALTEQRLVVFITPPGVISPQALQPLGLDINKVLLILSQEQTEALWAAEQCLKSGACHSVVMWATQSLQIHQIKRLQVACDTGCCRYFILREEKAESLSLPFDLSLSLQSHGKGLKAKINKRKHGWPSEHFTINMANYWPTLTLAPLPDNLLVFPQVKTG